MIFDADLGPVSHLVAGFPGATIPTRGLDALRALDESGRIDILDLEFVRKDDAGVVSWVRAADVGAPAFAASASELIDGDDIAAVGATMANDSVAVIVVWEDRTLIDVIATWTGESGTILSEGPIEVADLVDTLDRIEEN